MAGENTNQNIDKNFDDLNEKDILDLYYDVIEGAEGLDLISVNCYQKMGTSRDC